MRAARLLYPLANPGVYLGLLLAAILVALAYQTRPSYDIQLGTGVDSPLLQGFNGPEQPPKGSGLPYQTFRWSTGAAQITLQDVGRQSFDVALSVNGSRPQGQPAPILRVSSHGKVLLNAQPTPGLADYRFTVPGEASADGTLLLELSTNAFKQPGDKRELGLIVTRLRVSTSPAPARFVEPPVAPLFGVMSAVAILAVTLASIGWGTGGVVLGSFLLAFLAASLLVFDRLWLTSKGWYLVWPQVLMLGVAFELLSWLVGGWLLRRGGVSWTSLQRRFLLTLLLVVFCLRLAGELHPQIFVYDLGYHANLLHLVEQGQLLFTTQPAEFGGFGHSTFYLPTPYLFILPLKWLFGDELLAIRVLTVTLGTWGALAIFYIASKALRDARAGLLGALLYLTFPMSVLPYSWGITPNVFGEFFALCSLAIAVGAYPGLRPNRPAFYALIGALCIALLSHSGVLALIFTAFVIISALWLALALRSRSPAIRRSGAWTLAALAAAMLIAFVLYYRNFVGSMLNSIAQIRAERATQEASGTLRLSVGGSVEDNSLGLTVHEVTGLRDWFFGGLRGFWNEANAYYRVWPVAAAFFSYRLAWRSGRSAADDTRRGLALAAIGWAMAVALFALVGWATNLYVRYALFALPLLALGAGALLARIWGKGRAGGWLSLLVVTFFVVEALSLWQYRITYAFKLLPQP